MSAASQTQGAATSLPPDSEGPRDRQTGHYNPDPRRTPPKPTTVRDIVRLFQCRICSFPLREPLRLPCGKSICKQCVPETHVRSNITYPAIPDRLQGFQCPFADCGKDHAVKDCSVDVILNKASEYIRQEIERGKSDTAYSNLSTHIVTVSPDVWTVAGVPSLKSEENAPRAIKGGKLVATYSLADEGELPYSDDVRYEDEGASRGEDSLMFDDMDVLKKAQEATRPEMDCQVCYSLYYDPLTTECGHTFCRSCLHRILDHSPYCPVCRRILAISPLLDRSSSPSNDALLKIIETFWLDEILERKNTLEAEYANQQEEFGSPLFVCTLAFPHMPTFLHIFEPRYRLMIRRAMEGDRTFGMVLPRSGARNGEPPFYELGTLLRIVNIQYFPDGRSLIETVGLTRFKVVRHGMLNGYTVGKTERIDDMTLEEEESVEAAEVTPPAESTPADSEDAPAVQPETNPTAQTRFEDLQTLSTEKLMQFATEFVVRMQEKSAPWLTERMLTIYGPCPSDAAIFPWWFASMLPVREIEKYRLLGTRSVRDRLKICCSWIIEWEMTRWTPIVDNRAGMSPSAQSSD